jgi:signal transduction histidine kinase
VLGFGVITRFLCESEVDILYEFLKTNRDAILDLSAEKTRSLAGLRGASQQLKLGLPMFYEQLIAVLEDKLNSKPPEEMLSSAASHGKEFLKLGYSLSHVVHAYGAMCQAITELATRRNAAITSEEFNILNGCLDVAIATAVSEYQFLSNRETEDNEVKNLGFLAHELRNALSSATVAHEMIKGGLVGTGGSTAKVLEANLTRMRNLIDRSLSQVRMRAHAEVYVEKFHLFRLLDQIVVTAEVDANKRNQVLHSEIDSSLEVEADQQFLLSAVANLIQNAIKYSKVNGKIILRARLSGDRVLIEVEDECGGIDVEKVSKLFEPYTQASADRSGLGLGLSITLRAVELSGGKITVENNPGHGCTFTIDIPQKLVASPNTGPTVPGMDSVQPTFLKRN